MKTTMLGTGLALIVVALAAAANAAVEEICLNDGITGMAEVLETSTGSVTVVFEKEGAKVRLVLAASRMDPHCFYDVRRRHMEDTAENHVQLAIFCARNGMFKRGQFQMEVAEALDAAYVETLRKTPGVREGVAKSILEAGEKAFAKGQIERAEAIAVGVCARFHDLAVADAARDLLGRIHARRRMAEKAAADAARAEMDEAAQKEADAIAKALAPVEAARKKADETSAQAQQADNPSKAKKGYEEAAARYVEALRRCERVAAAHEHTDVASLEKALRADAVRALVNAGGIALDRGSTKEAGDCADRAQKIDPESGLVQSLRQRIETSEAMNDTFDARYRRGERRGRR